jgi:hypothetical protein
MKTIRQFVRSPRQTRIEINGVRGMTSDLSAGGCSAEVRTLLKTGSTVIGRIALGDRSFDYRGQVIWTVPAGTARRVGIRFSGVENAYFAALDHVRSAEA